MTRAVAALCELAPTLQAADGEASRIPSAASCRVGASSPQRRNLASPDGLALPGRVKRSAASPSNITVTASAWRRVPARLATHRPSLARCQQPYAPRVPSGDDGARTTKASYRGRQQLGFRAGMDPPQRSGRRCKERPNDPIPLSHRPVGEDQRRGPVAFRHAQQRLVIGSTVPRPTPEVSPRAGSAVSVVNGRERRTMASAADADVRKVTVVSRATSR